MSIIAINGLPQSGKDTLGEIFQILGNNNHFTDKAVVGFLGREHYDPDVKIEKFAANLKKCAAIILGCNPKDFESEEFKNKPLGEEWLIKYYEVQDNQGGFLEKFYDLEEARKGLSYWDENLHNNHPPVIENYEFIPTVRKFLQLLGTDACRNMIHPNIWVNSFFNNYSGKICSEKESNDFVMAGDEKIHVKYPKWVITDLRFPNELEACLKRDAITIKITRPSKKPKELHISDTALDYYKEWDYEFENSKSLIELVKFARKIIKETNFLKN